MVATPNPPTASQPPTGIAPVAGQPGSPSGNGAMIALTVISVVFLMASLALLAFAVSQRGPGDSGDVVVAEDGTTDEAAGGSRNGTGSTDGSTDESKRTTTTRPATTTTEASTPAGPISPESVSVTQARESIPRLKCTDEYMSYGGEQLIDGDNQLGWGASAKDGAGERATINFGAPVNLTSVGLIPGYARMAPHSKAGCKSVPAFPLNRQIQKVRWTFDDGTSVEQSFELQPEMQRYPVEVTTSSVTLEILSTIQPPGADADTIISEAAFEGSA